MSEKLEITSLLVVQKSQYCYQALPEESYY